MTPTPNNVPIEALESDYLAGRNPLAYIPYAEALRQVDRLPEAHRICQMGLSQRGQSIAGQLLHARILADMGRNEQAAEECERILDTVPQSQGARRLLIDVALKNRQFLRVVELIDEVEVVAADDPQLIAALIEAQHGLADRFVNEVRESSVPRHRPPVAMGTTSDEVLDQIARHRGVDACELISDGDRGGPLCDMVHEWSSILNSHHRLSMAIIESPDRTIFARRLEPGDRTLVVSLPEGSNVGPIKMLADRLCSLATREGALL
jgi:hypothetical protein